MIVWVFIPEVTLLAVTQDRVRTSDASHYRFRATTNARSSRYQEYRHFYEAREGRIKI